MSGGCFDYQHHRMHDIADEIDILIRDNNKKDEYGYSREYSKETLKEMKKGAKLARLAYLYIHRIDYLVSGNDGEENFHKRLKEELEKFKTK